MRVQDPGEYGHIWILRTQHLQVRSRKRLLRGGREAPAREGGESKRVLSVEPRLESLRWEESTVSNSRKMKKKNTEKWRWEAVPSKAGEAGFSVVEVKGWTGDYTEEGVYLSEHLLMKRRVDGGWRGTQSSKRGLSPSTKWEKPEWERKFRYNCQKRFTV